MEDQVTGKRCRTCGETKPRDAFHRDSAKKDGLASRCRECKRAYHCEWCARNSESVKARAKEWYLNNTDRAKERKRAYYESNKDKWTSRGTLNMRAWRAANKERDRANYRRYYRNNVHKVISKAHLRRLMFVRAEGSFSAKDIRNLYEQQDGLCAYCRTDLNGRYHIDHRTPLSRGGSNWPSNLCLACAPCNWAKGAMTAEDFAAS